MNKIIMFTTETWPHCHTAKSFLRKKGYAFEAKDVNKDVEARNEFTKRGLRGVPAFIINGQVVEGLDTSKIESLVDHETKNCPNCDARLRLPKNKGIISVNCPKCETTFKMDTGTKE